MNKKDSYCTKCKCKTVSMRKGRANYVCIECGADKSLSDFLLYEAEQYKGSN